jgi:hypothetical protein
MVVVSKKGRSQVESVASAHTIGKGWCLQDAVGWQHAYHGRQNALMKALNCSSCPYTIFLISNLLIDEGGSCVAAVGCIACSQFL